MRKSVPILFGLGGFLLFAGLVAAIWAPGAAKKTPIDTNSTTHLSGQVKKLDTATQQMVPNAVKATSVTKSDSKVSDGKVVAFTNTSCLVIDTGNPPDCVQKDDPRLITASTDVFAADRRTAEAVNSAKYLPSNATDHAGLNNKWPFDAAKKTYPYWDGTTGKAVDAVFDRTAKVNGLDTYVYKATIKGAPIDILEGVTGTYDDVKEIYIEPKTGAIINQVDNQQRALDDGTQVLDLQLAFTKAQIATNVKDAHTNINSLALVTKIIPLVGIIGGLLCLLFAGLMLRSGRRTSEPAHVDNKVSLAKA